MERREKNLVILAAGLGSRFKGGIKQLQPVGPGGECIMEYSVYDAIEAGFNRVVFIIRRDIQALFDEIIGDRIGRLCKEKGVEVVYAYQDKQDLPEPFVCPAERAKPWGTGHALLSCRGILHGGFVVINADDYYGKEPYRLLSAFLDSLDENSKGEYALAGFRLGNTLSEFGGVTRGICQTDGLGWMTEIRETKNVVSTAGGAAVKMDEGMIKVNDNSPVSMNMWAFTPDVLERLCSRFSEFLKENIQSPDREFLIPTEVGGWLVSEEVRVRVIPTGSRWLGMTHREDMPLVRSVIAQMTAEGKYPSPLCE